MADVGIRPEGVDVEQIMQQLRTRIRERRAADYTEGELQQLAGAKLDQLVDSRGAHPRLAEQFLQQRPPSPDVPTYEFEDSTIFGTHRGLLRSLRALLRPVLKLFFNPDPISRALHLQAKINAEFQRRFRAREEMDPVLAEVIRGLVVEVTRAGLEVQSLKLRLESLSARMDFDERRARSRDGAAPAAVPRTPAADQPVVTAETQDATEGHRQDPRSAGAAGPGGDPRRRRRRRRRRRGSAGQPGWGATPAEPGNSAAPPVGSAGSDEPAGDFEPDGSDDDGASDSDEP